MQCKVTQNMRNTLINRAVIYNNPSLFTACHFAMKTCTWLYILTFIGTPKTQLPVSRLTFDRKIAIFLCKYKCLCINDLARYHAGMCRFRIPTDG